MNIQFRDFAFGLETSRYADHRYILQLNDGIHGEEPWLYNSTTGSLSLLIDQIAGFEGSLPGEYLPAPNSEDFYFIMLSERFSRQLFKLDSAAATEDPEAPPIPSLIAFPSPTTGTIHLNQDLQELRLYDLNGRLIYETSTYVKRTPLHLGFVPNGIYVVVGINETGEFVRTRVVVCGRGNL
ncbi:MAG: T9SS type A sorting domain-containing protein [Bacteroidota bacterium]